MNTVAENQQDDAPVSEADRAAADSLRAGYEKVNPPADSKPAEQDDTAPAETVDTAATDTTAAATTETAPAPKPAEAAPDPWEGVPPIVRQTLEGISGKLGTLDTLSQDLKRTSGRVAVIQGELATAKATAKTMENAPSAAQIEAAAKDPEEWAELKKEFPEWTTATEGYIKQALAAERADLLKHIPKSEPVDVEGLRRDVSVIVGDAVQRGRQLARVDQKYPNWEKDVHAPDGRFTPEFAVWMEKQAPDVKALADSVKADDAIKMLDMYYDHRKSVARKDKNQARLATNVAPKSATGGGPSILPDEAGLRVGYNRHKRA